MSRNTKKHLLYDGKDYHVRVLALTPKKKFRFHFVVGPPFCGKTFVANELALAANEVCRGTTAFLDMSTLVRNARKEDSQLGQALRDQKEKQDRGLLLDDNPIIAVFFREVAEAVRKGCEHIVGIGIPRTETQVRFISAEGIRCGHIFNMVIDPENALRLHKERMSSGDRREDDASVATRMSEFVEKTQIAIEFAAKTRYRVKIVDANKRDVEKIAPIAEVIFNGHCTQIMAFLQKRFVGAAATSTAHLAQDSARNFVYVNGSATGAMSCSLR